MKSSNFTAYLVDFAEIKETAFKLKRVKGAKDRCFLIDIAIGVSRMVRPEDLNAWLPVLKQAVWAACLKIC